MTKFPGGEEGEEEADAYEAAQEEPPQGVHISDLVTVYQDALQLVSLLNYTIGALGLVFLVRGLLAVPEYWSDAVSNEVVALGCAAILTYSLGRLSAASRRLNKAKR